MTSMLTGLGLGKGCTQAQTDQFHTLMYLLHADQTSVKLLKGNRAAWVDREFRGAWGARAGVRPSVSGSPPSWLSLKSCMWAGWDLVWLYLPVIWDKEGASFPVKALPGLPDHLCRSGSLRCKDGPHVLTRGNCQHPNSAPSQPRAAGTTSILESLHTPRQSPWLPPDRLPPDHRARREHCWSPSTSLPPGLAGS